MAPRFGGCCKEGIEDITNGFSQDNFISEFQFGKLYRGMSRDRHIMVKVWDKDEVDGFPVWPEDKDARLRDEGCLAFDDRIHFHPKRIKIYGISWADFTPTMMFLINPLDTLQNLIDKDNFSWLHRINAALDIASFLKCLHGCKPFPYLVRNISAAHIIIDKDYNAKLYEFSMISGGILADKTELLNQHIQGCYGYIDPDYACRGIWSKKCDVFAFGVVLLGLISKRVQTETYKKTNSEPFLYEWAHNKRQEKGLGSKLLPFDFSLVHKSFEDEPFFCARDGIMLTMLAMQCVEYSPEKRPKMKQIFNCIQELYAVRKNVTSLSSGNMDVVRELSISERATKTLLKYLASKEKIISAWKGSKFIAPIRLSYEDIKRYTNGFSEENFIQIYPFGKLYHGSIDSRTVTVKTWEDVKTHYIDPGDNEVRLRDELILLRHPKFVSHPHIVKMIGYCYENEKLSAVYNLQSLDSLFNLISKECFTWNKRIKFILELAGLLKYLQQGNLPHSPYVLRNISTHAILVDKHYKPKLFDFGMLLGGIMKDQEAYRFRHVHFWDYYIDPYTNCYDYYTEVSDIYSLGMVILNLITKIVYMDTEEDTEEEDEVEFDQWVRSEYEKAKSTSPEHAKRFSLADTNFSKEFDFYPMDGRRVTKLAMQCIHTDSSKRPTINQVIRRLNSLKIIRNNS